MINFKDIRLEDKQLFNKYVGESALQGCEMSFANLFLWGKQQLALKDNHLLFFSSFSQSFYPFPCGEGDKKSVIDSLMEDAKQRGIPFKLTSVYPAQKEILQQLYPNRFEFITNDGWYDYVYDIDDLATFPGKKYHKKRTHFKNFEKTFPNYSVQPISQSNKKEIEKMVEKWYEDKQSDNDNSLNYEKEVFKRAMNNFEQLELEGIALYNEQTVLAVTFASRLSLDTFDVHFEKAVKDTGAYVAICHLFAQYIKNKYPFVKYLDREEDMGLEGLRKSKRSYYPHHQVVKYHAILKQE